MKTTVKKLLSLALAAVLLFALAACGSGDDKPSAGENTPPPAEMQELTLAAFSDYDLTMVNCFATWCGPCVREIPELQELSENFAGSGVQVIGVVLDALNPKTGEPDPNTAAAVATLRERSGAKYGFYMPDYQLFDGRLASVAAVPETFFVDRYGNVVGETYVGARSLDDWTDIVELTMTDQGISCESTGGGGFG